SPMRSRPSGGYRYWTTAPTWGPTTWPWPTSSSGALTSTRSAGGWPPWARPQLDAEAPRGRARRGGGGGPERPGVAGPASVVLLALDLDAEVLAGRGAAQLGGAAKCEVDADRDRALVPEGALAAPRGLELQRGAPGGRRRHRSLGIETSGRAGGRAVGPDVGGAGHRISGLEVERPAQGPIGSHGRIVQTLPVHLEIYVGPRARRRHEVARHLGRLHQQLHVLQRRLGSELMPVHDVAV